MDRITLGAFRLSCIVGILPRERVEEQPLDIEIELGLDLDGAAGGDLSRSVDYAAVCEQVTFLAREGRWELLESLAAAIARLLLLPPAPGEARAQVERVRVALRKPEVLGGRAVPGIVVERDAAWAGAGEVLQETPHVGAWRVLGAPEGPSLEIAPGVHLVVRRR